MQSGCRKQQILLLFKQGAVGGQDDLETGFTGQMKKLFQVGMAQRLTHQMEIEIIGIGAQLGQQGRKFFLCHGPFFPFCAGAEGTG